MVTAAVPTGIPGAPGAAGPVKILIVTPAPPGSRKGNRVTAMRWRRILRELGHAVAVAGEFRRQHCDLLVALHARRSAASLGRFAAAHPERPVVLALTGTDLYQDIHVDPEAQGSLELADRFVVLQALGAASLPERFRDRARVIYQSIVPPRREPPSRARSFNLSVVGHLRPVKDPFRAAEASRLLPPRSRVRVRHSGAALSDDMAVRAQREQRENRRYRWLGELPRWRAMREIARSRALVLTSKMEGGAHVVCEALACGVPVLSSRIDGSVGLLGEEYPGYFPVGDTRALADLMLRCEEEDLFLRRLRRHCSERAGLVDPERERRSWEELLAELCA